MVGGIGHFAGHFPTSIDSFVNHGVPTKSYWVWGYLAGFVLLVVVSTIVQFRNSNDKKKQQQLFQDRVAASDIVVSTALIPGRPAPVLISSEMVGLMKPGAVIMDLAAENGGNCSLTEPDKVVVENGVIIDGTVNLAGTMSVHASQLYSKNVSAFLLHGFNKETKQMNLDDEIIEGAMFIKGGEVVDERTQNAIKEGVKF